MDKAVKRAGLRGARRKVAAVVLLLGLAVSGPAQDDAEKEYEKWMKTADETAATIKANLEADLSKVEEGARKIVEVFDLVESFWINLDMEEAQLWAQDVMDAADELEEAAASGNKNAARSAFQNMMSNCTGCHNTYREELPGGEFRIRK